MTSRASEITLFLIILQASIGFVNATELFKTKYYATPQNQYMYSVNNLSDYTKIVDEPTPLDYITMLVTWTWQTLILALTIIFSVVFIFPQLVITFGVPVVLATFMQVGIYYVYATWYMQYKSGKGFKLYD